MLKEKPMENSLSELQKERRRLDKRIGSHLRKGEFTLALKAMSTILDPFEQEPTREQLVEQLDGEQPTARRLAILHWLQIHRIEDFKDSYNALLMQEVRERYGASLNQDPPAFEELLEKYEGYENDSGDGPERGE